MDDFEKRSKALFDASVDTLNGNIRSRLTQARHAALAQVPANRGRRFWMPAAGLTAAALLAVLVVMPFSQTERTLPAAVASADDMALLLNSDDLEMLEDMEFYAWLESEMPEANATGDDANS